MTLKAFFALSTALLASQIVSALDFSASKWIWTPEPAVGLYPVSSRAFRRDFYAPDGRQPVSANIILTVDNGYTFYVNGQQVGTGSDFLIAQAYCVKLKGEGCNVFAVNATNVAIPGPDPRNPAGVLATIQIRYADGFTNTIVTDASWHSFVGNVPVGFQDDGFDDSSWPAAVVEAGYGAAPWGQITIPNTASNVAAASPPNLDNSNWIWTNEVTNGVAPVGARAFRRTITLPPGQAATSANIVLGVDDAFTFYVNGKQVGTGTTPNWPNAHRYIINFGSPATEITLAVDGSNASGPAGVVAAIELIMEDCDCGSVMSYITDASWKYSLTVPAGFQNPGFDDSKWPAAVVEYTYASTAHSKLNVPTEGTVINM